ncbi:hypothetical protein OIU76_004942 [Salix suchowensis]|nr:hypothetical protein OIU76_004942 [Salix suchowensis]
MDYNKDSGNGEHWGCQHEDYCLHKDFNGGISQCLWNEVTLNGEDLSYMLDETTPAKACGGLAYHVDHDANMNKEPEEWRGTCLQFKRRRLQFDTQFEDSPFCEEEITPVFLKSNETKESLEEVFPQASQWDSGYQDTSASSYNGLDQSSEWWIGDCFNDSEMQFSPNDMNHPGASDIQIHISDFCNDPPEFEAKVVQKCVTRTPRKSFVPRFSFLPCCSRPLSLGFYGRSIRGCLLFRQVKACCSYGKAPVLDMCIQNWEFVFNIEWKHRLSGFE